MKTNKFLSLGMSGVLFLSACGSKNNATPLPEVQKVAAVSQEDQHFFDFWSEVAVSAQPQIGLAEILRPYLAQDLVKTKTEKLIPDAQFVSEFLRERTAIKHKYLVGQVPFADDFDLLNGSLLYREDHRAFSSEGFVQKFDWAVQIEIQNRAMQSLVQTFTERAQKVAKELAPYVLREMSPEDMQKVNAVSGTREEKVQKIVVILKKYDKTLSAYKFSPEDNVKLIVLGLVAGVVADHLANNQTVQQIIAAVTEFKQTVELVQEVAGLVQAIENNKKQMKQDWDKMRQGMSGFAKDIKEVKLNITDQTRAESMRLIDDAVRGRLKEGPGGSFVSTRQELNKNMQIFVNSAASAANGLNNILNATEAITTKLGIKLDPGVKEAIKTARQISSAVSVAKNVMTAYATGGVIGALGVFGGDGGMAVFGGGAQDAMAADLKEIKKELQEIKRMQVQMLEMQVETMKMIRDLALMLESYHREQMYVLKELKGLTLMNYEAQLIGAHQEIRSCEEMLKFAVRMNRNLNDNLFQNNSVSVVGLSREVIYAPLKETGKMHDFIQSIGAGKFASCQEGLNKAFASASAKENPIQLVERPEENLLNIFYREKYVPLLHRLKALEKNRSYSALALHIPSGNVSTLQKKELYERGPDSSRYMESLQHLISAQGLERYAEILLLVSPIVSFDKPIWEQFLQDKNALKGSYGLSWQRSDLWIRNAFSLTQTTISQEALLAGEPLLKSLYFEFADILRAKDDCRVPTSVFSCAVKTNPMLRDNLLMYYLSNYPKVKRGMVSYREALQTKNVDMLVALLGADMAGFVAARKVNGEDKLILKWSAMDENLISVFPTADQLWAGDLKYSENMPRLLALQEKLANALMEITPMYVNDETKEGLLKALLVK